jgi:hypothetical protein
MDFRLSNEDPEDIIPTHKAYYDLADMLSKLSEPDWAMHLNKEMSFLLLYGSLDEMSDFGRSVKEVYRQMRLSAIMDVSIRSYENSPASLLKSSVRDEVHKDILSWILLRNNMKTAKVRSTQNL